VSSAQFQALSTCISSVNLHRRTQRHGGEGARRAPCVDVEQARQRGVRQEAVAEDGRAGLQVGLRVAVPPRV